jgi:hypothetical protein
MFLSLLWHLLLTLFFIWFTSERSRFDSLSGWMLVVCVMVWITPCVCFIAGLLDATGVERWRYSDGWIGISTELIMRVLVISGACGLLAVITLLILRMSTALAVFGQKI